VAENRLPLPERDVYEMHCRLEHVMPAAVASKLKCRYTDRGNAFLRLARVKEEEAYLKPLILIYHDVIYDSEIETIKKLSVPRVCYQFSLCFSCLYSRQNTEPATNRACLVVECVLSC
jgi:hypothetical protein